MRDEFGDDDDEEEESDEEAVGDPSTIVISAGAINSA